MASSSQNAYSVAQTEILLGLEAVRGTAAATTLAVPVRAPKYKPDLHYSPDESLQGSMVEIYNEVPGLRYDSHGWDLYPYLDTFPIYVMAELGSPDTKTVAPTSGTITSAVTSGTSTLPISGTVSAGTWITFGTGSLLETHLVASYSSPNATLVTPTMFAHASGTAYSGLTGHKFSLLNNAGSTGNQPPSCTIDDFDGEEWRQLTAAQLSKLTIKGNATGLVDATVDWFANPAVTPSTPTYTPSTALPPPGWASQIFINNSQVAYIEEWEVDLDRAVKAIPAITGTQEYFEYLANGLKCTGKVTAIETSGAPLLSLYENWTQVPVDITLFDTTQGMALNIHGSKCIFKTGQIDRGAQGEVKVALDFDYLPNSTDATAGGVSPITISVANLTTTAYAGS